MFYIVKYIQSELTAQIARDLDRNYEAVLNLVEARKESGDIEEFELYDVCEADKTYVTTGEIGGEDEGTESPRAWTLK